jgi:hypothetical protein
MHDIIMIGGGISSLYAAYKLLQKNPDLSILLLEKEARLGGRTWKEKFNTTNVVVGAGVLRAKKDKIPIKLLDTLGIKYNISKHTSDYILPFKVELKELFEKLKQVYSKDPTKYINKTFKQFAESVIGKKLYSQFRTQSGYSDYDKQNAHDTLYNYNFDDNYFNSPIISVDWVELITRLQEFLKGYKHFKIMKNSTVKSIQYGQIFEVITNKDKYQCKQLICGTDINSFKKIFNNLPNNILKPYKKIIGQPFLLLYAKFSKDSTLIMKNYIKTFTIVNGVLQKMIPINPNDGIYLVAYNDNKNAIKLKPYVKNKKFISNLVKTTLGIKEDIEIKDMTHYYWENGTHYFKPYQNLYQTNEFYKMITNPIKNLYVIGEMVAQKQGWIGGTLETVDKVIKLINVVK